jgi:phosphatidylinositol N-acetylglucosaminyltransferase subunit C
MSTAEWQKVLWKTQSYPDNYIPERDFLASLKKNRKFKRKYFCHGGVFDFTHITANFKPYTYWPLVLASCAITQQLATIYIFLAVFVRLKECSLDPRILVWITVTCFVGGYTTWELLGCSRPDRAQRNTDGLCVLSIPEASK